jgi:hypothetical protein
MTGREANLVETNGGHRVHMWAAEENKVHTAVHILGVRVVESSLVFQVEDILDWIQ